MVAGAHFGLPGPPTPREPAEILVRIVDDKATLSVDASGDLLQFRAHNYRH